MNDIIQKVINRDFFKNERSEVRNKIKEIWGSEKNFYADVYFACYRQAFPCHKNRNVLIADLSDLYNETGSNVDLSDIGKFIGDVISEKIYKKYVTSSN